MFDHGAMNAAMQVCAQTARGTEFVSATSRIALTPNYGRRGIGTVRHSTTGISGGVGK